MPDGYEHHLPYVHAILFTLCKKLPESAVMMIAAILVQLLPGQRMKNTHLCDHTGRAPLCAVDWPSLFRF
ncbi:hypothetical protein OUZ56_027900 [Daphnia magna]|uniref:Uncharacterized protein n=1 Tax=Daphnia magna TaxID=35525 RepID=A0ABR0B294_9CRUS|nr:hypothetical protein OUZ56_027900 [Daphnia magna]